MRYLININKAFVRFLKNTSVPLCCFTCIFNLYSSPSSEQIEQYINGIENLSAEFYQSNSNSNDLDKGSITIDRNTKNKKTSVTVNYDTGIISSIVLKGRYITITYRKTGKSKTYSILTTPIYAILAGKLKLEDFKHQVIEDTDSNTTVRIMHEKQVFDLGFKKENKKVNKILYWTVYNGNSWTTVTFDDKTYSVKEKTKVSTVKN